MAELSNASRPVLALDDSDPPAPSSYSSVDVLAAKPFFFGTGMIPVSQILFNFYNGELYRIVVTYEQDATAGLTEDDMVQAMSIQYGTTARAATEVNFFPTNNLDSSMDKVISFLPTSDPYRSADSLIARWDDPQNSVSLFRSHRTVFLLATVLSKRLDAQAERAISETETFDKEQAPRKEVDRKKKEVDDLEVTRLANQKTFRP